MERVNVFMVVGRVKQMIENCESIISKISHFNATYSTSNFRQSSNAAGHFLLVFPCIPKICQVYEAKCNKEFESKKQFKFNISNIFHSVFKLVDSLQ